MFSSIIVKILLAAVLALGVGNVAQWVRHGWTIRGLKTQVENLEKDNIKLKTDLKNAKIEAEYAPKIKPMREIAKRRQPKKPKPVVIDTKPPPKVDPGEWADACAVAQSINDNYGVRDGGKKPLSGKATDARLWPAPGRTSGNC
jgi:hypothetical protein